MCILNMSRPNGYTHIVWKFELDQLTNNKYNISDQCIPLTMTLVAHLVLVLICMHVAGELELRKRSHAVQRGLPRPSEVNSSVLRPKETQMDSLQKVKHSADLEIRISLLCILYKTTNLV